MIGTKPEFYDALNRICDDRYKLYDEFTALMHEHCRLDFIASVCPYIIQGYPEAEVSKDYHDVDENVITPIIRAVQKAALKLFDYDEENDGFLEFGDWTEEATVYMCDDEPLENKILAARESYCDSILYLSAINDSLVALSKGELSEADKSTGYIVYRELIEKLPKSELWK